MTKKEKAIELFEKGYNCAQAVAGAFSDEIGMDTLQIVKAVSGFGGGIGRLREVCGAVSGMVFVANMLYGYESPTDADAKKAHYSDIQSLAKSFSDMNGSYICRELLGLSISGADSPVPEKRTTEYYQKRPCVELVGDAAEILEKFIAEHK